MKRKHVRFFSSIAIVIITVFSIWAYRLYPVAIVGTGYISAQYWDQAYALAKKIDPQASNEKISTQLVKIKEEQQLVSSLNLAHDNAAFMNEYKFYTTGKTQEYQDLLKNYFGGDDNLFLEFVVKPRVYDGLLRIKYNLDFIANKSAYSRAQNILGSLNNGRSFEDLAKAESDDKITGQLGGDLGFVQSGEILPELEKIIIQSPVGEVKKEIIASRLGYHILYPVEVSEKDGHKVWHVKHIFVQTFGFEDWLNPMLSRFWIWRIK